MFAVVPLILSGDSVTISVPVFCFGPSLNASKFPLFIHHSVMLTASRWFDGNFVFGELSPDKILNSTNSSSVIGLFR